MHMLILESWSLGRVKCIFIGYGSGVKAYRLWNPETKKILLSRNVVFNESVMYHDNLSTDAPSVGGEKLSVQVEHVDEIAEQDDTQVHGNDDVVPPSPPILQQLAHSIAAGHPKRNKGPCPRLIEECDLMRVEPVGWPDLHGFEVDWWGERGRTRRTR